MPPEVEEVDEAKRTEFVSFSKFASELDFRPERVRRVGYLEELPSDLFGVLLWRLIRVVS